MDAPITEAELHYAPHLNPTPGEMTPTGHYHRQRTQRLVLRDLSSYVVGLLAGEYPQDEVEILQSASRHKRAPAVTSKQEVDRLRQEMEGLRLRASTAETRVAELEKEVEQLRSMRGGGIN